MCNYCGKPKPTEGWHDCPKSLEAKAKIDSIVTKVYAQFGPVNKSNKVKEL